MSGEPNSRLLAATLGVLWLYDTGKLGLRAPLYRPTNNDLQTVFDKYPSVRDSISVGLTINQKFGKISGASLAAFHCLFALKDKAMADEFFQRLVDGEGLTSTSPIHKLREKFIELMSLKRPALISEFRAYVVKAWNAYRSGQQIKILKFTQKGRFKEDFPEIL
jgi:hypothetical protein